MEKSLGLLNTGNQIIKSWSGAGLQEDNLPFRLATLKAVFVGILVQLK